MSEIACTFSNSGKVSERWRYWGPCKMFFCLTSNIVRWTLISARSWSDFWVCLSSEAQVALWQPLFMHLLYTDVYCWVDTAEGKAVHLPSWVRWNGLAGEEYRSVPGIAECVFPRGLPAAILPVGRGKDVRSREQEFSSVSTGWPRGLWKRTFPGGPKFAAAQEPNEG